MLTLIFTNVSTCTGNCLRKPISFPNLSISSYAAHPSGALHSLLYDFTNFVLYTVFTSFTRNLHLETQVHILQIGQNICAGNESNPNQRTRILYIKWCGDGRVHRCVSLSARSQYKLSHTTSRNSAVLRSLDASRNC